MSASTRILFALGARLHKSAAEIERLSVRELLGWVDFFNAAAAAPVDDVPDVHTLTRAQLRAMFHD